MAAQQFVLSSDAAGGLNQFLLDSDSATGIAIAFNAQQAQQVAFDLIQRANIGINAQQRQQNTTGLIPWGYVTLANPIYTGAGSVAYNGQFTGTPPVAGDIVAFDSSLVSVATDGTISANNYGSAQARYFDGSAWYPFTIWIVEWAVYGAQPQQSTMQPRATVAPGFTSQQPEQAAFNVAPLSVLSVAAQQQQQAAFALATRAVLTLTAQQSQQATFSMAASGAITFAAQQREQAAFGIVATATIGFAAAQPQSAIFNVIVQPPLLVTFSAQQRQQGAFAFTGTSTIAINPQAPQQAAVDVIVPPAVNLGFTAQQPGQSAMGFSAAQRAALLAQQPQQALFDVLSHPVVNFTAQQLQQASVSFPTLPAPVIESSAQQQQQGLFDFLSSVEITFAAQQLQRGVFNVLPLPAQMPTIDPEEITLTFGTGSLPYQQDATKVVYLGRDNAASIGVLYMGAPLDLASVTRVTVGLVGTDIVISSNDGPDLISWAQGSNVLTFRFGSLVDIPPGIYPIAIVLFDFAHDDGQTIAGPGLPLALLDFEQDRNA